MKSITRHSKTMPKIRPLAPQHNVIHTSYGKYLTSYDSVIVFLPNDESTIYLGEDWNYSVTTLKYRNQFLNTTTKELEAKLASGSAKIVSM